LHRLPAKLTPGVGVITAQAGAGLAILDLLQARNVSVPPLSLATQEYIAARLPPMTFQKNPVDTARPSPTFSEVVAAVAGDPHVDAVACYALSEPAALRPTEVLSPIQRRVGKPLLFGTMGPLDEIRGDAETLRAQGLYVAHSPEELARATSTLCRDAFLQARLARAGIPEPVASAALGVESPDEHSAKQTLEILGIQTPRRAVCASHEEAHQALNRLAKPVVAKILAAEVAHKTEVGGVQLNITDAATLDDALRELDAIPLSSRRRYLLEEMAPPGCELIVAAKRDESFGPMVMVGLGGIYAEALRDTVTRLAPLTRTEAEEMIEQLRIAPLFSGWRGQAKLDRPAVARSLVALGQFLCSQPGVDSFEINPLRVYPSGVLALDALLICK